MAYFRANFQDPYGTTNDNAYTHIQSYKVDVIHKIAIITLVTYVSQEAKENGFQPISTEVQKITGVDYETIFGDESTVMEGPGQIEQSLQSHTLSKFYTSLNETDNWSGDNITNHYEDEWTDPEESDWVDLNNIAIMLLSAYSEENLDAITEILDENFPSSGEEEETLAVRLEVYKWLLFDYIRVNDGEGLYSDGLITHIESLIIENEGEGEEDGEGEDDIYGCTNPLACNYNSEATIDDGSCVFAEEGYDCDGEPLEEGDSDGDGTPDSDDAFPLDPEEDTDTDGDGTGDNADTDDDDDGFKDDEEEAAGTDPLDPTSFPSDEEEELQKELRQ